MTSPSATHSTSSSRNETLPHPPQSSRKIRSRYSAYCRRINENDEFDRLAAALPIDHAISSQMLDKASVVRLACTCIRLHSFAIGDYSNASIHHQRRDDDYQTQFYCNNATSIAIPDPLSSYRMGACILEVNMPLAINLVWSEFSIELLMIAALDGFLLCCGHNGDLLYVSETISLALGLSQIDMIGNSIFDYIHNDDMHRWQSAFSRQTMSSDYGNYVPMTNNEMLTIRMKSTLTKRIKKDLFKCCFSGYKVINIEMHGRATTDDCFTGVCCFCLPLPTSANACASVRLDRSTFSITLHLDFTINYIDPRGEEMLGKAKDNSRSYSVDETTETTAFKGISFYQKVHICDHESAVRLHNDVIHLGAGYQPAIRLLRDCQRPLWTSVSGMLIGKQAKGGVIHSGENTTTTTYITLKFTAIDDE